MEPYAILPAVLRERVREGIQAGIVAAAATLGVLVGFGAAHGAWLQPVNAVAHLVVGSRAFLIDDFAPVVTLLGLLVHVASIVLWAVVFSLLAGRLRGWRLGAAAAAFAGAAYVVDQRLTPARLAPGFERSLSGLETAAIYVVFAVALGLGVRFAREAREAA